jgi:hypothetical protein
MGSGMRAARVDRNQNEVVDALCRAGAKVTLLHRVGGGCPDLLVWNGTRFAMAEIKDGKKPPSARKLTPEQESWHLAHSGAPVYVISSVEQALEVLMVSV